MERDNSDLWDKSIDLDHAALLARNNAAENASMMYERGTAEWREAYIRRFNREMDAMCINPKKCRYCGH